MKSLFIVLTATLFLIFLLALIIVLNTFANSLAAYHGIISSIILATGLAGIIMLFIMKRLKRRVKKGTVLTYNLEGTIKEDPPEALLESVLTPTLNFYQLLRTLDYALNDNDVAMLLIKIRNLAVGWGKLAELYRHLEKWREKGKPVYCFLGDATNKEYFLATAASKIHSSSGSMIFFNGLCFELPFYKKLLDQIGVGFEFEQAGTYKTAFDQFMHERITPEHKEMLEELLNNMQSQLVTIVAAARKITEEEVRELLNKGIFTFKTAKEEKLVDEIGTMEQVKTAINEQNKKAEFLPLMKYFQKRNKRLNKGAKKSIALIPVKGVIREGESSYHPIMGKMTGSDDLMDLLEEAAKNKQVSAILLRINSPGGSGSASEMLWQKIKEISAEKPVVVSMSDVAASGGYYIATAAHSIIASPFSITGSIGVVSGKLNIEKLLANLQIQVETLKISNNANMMSLFSRLTDEQRQALQRMNYDFYDLFLQRVTEGRTITREEAEQAAEGRVWLATEAINLKLVDKLGGINEALEIIKEKIKVPAGEPVRIMIMVKRKPFWQKIRVRNPFTAHF